MVVLDIETSGLDSQKNSLVSIGAMDFNDVSQIFYEECQIWTDSSVDVKSLEVIGFTEEQLRDSSKKTPAEILQKFIDWLAERSDRTIAGQNVHWDLEFLREELKRSGIKHHFGYRIVDLHTLAYTKMKEKKIPLPMNKNRTDLNLDVITSLTGIHYRRKSHNALEDVRLEAESFYRLMFGKNLLPEFAEDEVPEILMPVV